VQTPEIRTGARQQSTEDYPKDEECVYKKDKSCEHGVEAAGEDWTHALTLCGLILGNKLGASANAQDCSEMNTQREIRNDCLEARLAFSTTYANFPLAWNMLLR